MKELRDNKVPEPIEETKLDEEDEDEDEDLQEVKIEKRSSSQDKSKSQKLDFGPIDEP